MQWDLGLRGAGLLILMSLGFGAIAQLLAARATTRWVGPIAAIAYFVGGLLISEVWFGWATEEELQPNIDGLSFDEVLLIGVVPGLGAVLATRYVARRPGRKPRPRPSHDSGDRVDVLVAYASRHGSTAAIAERIAETLRSAGLGAEARPTAEVHDLEPYDAVVLGGAAYMYHWLREATAFARRHRTELRDRPLWLFSSGPLGTDLVDDEGRDVLEGSRPKEFEELTALLRPRGERVFFGAWDPDAPPVGLVERLVRHAPASREALPSGDFRDWPTIVAWAEEIAAELSPPRA